MTYCNAILPIGKLSNVIYISYGKVFRGTPNISMFWLYSENGSILERTVNRALIVHTTQFIFNFTIYQNYPLALTLKITNQKELCSKTLYGFVSFFFFCVIIHLAPFEIISINNFKQNVLWYAVIIS